MPDYNPTLRDDRMELLNTEASGGKLALYTGPKPAAGGAATTKLAEFSLGTPAGTVASAVLTFTDPADATVIADGTAVWARISDSATAWVADFTVSTTSGSGEIRLTDVNLLTGMILDITSLTITEGNP
jgi:hypothetical protein